MINQKVFIVLVNHNGHLDTVECLESIFHTENLNAQVMVVDNSDDEHSIKAMVDWAEGSVPFKQNPFSPLKENKIVKKPLNYKRVAEVELLEKIHTEKLLFIKAKENKGFAAANNIALKYIQKLGAKEDIIWLLNNDTVVDKNSLHNQINELKRRKDERIGILGSKLVEYYSPKKIQAIGGSFNKATFTSKHIGSGAPIASPKTMFKKIDYVIGASMLVNKKFLDDVGLMNEAYFLYYEEIDWTYRAKEKKWKIDWCENSFVYHKEGASAGSSMRAKTKSRASDIISFESRKNFFKTIKGNKILFACSSILLIVNRLRRFQFKTAYMFCKILIK